MGGAAPAADLSFVDVTNQTGVIASHQPSEGTGGSLAGGAVGDFNNDGWQDIFFPAGGGTPDKLFINNGDGTFSDQASDWGIAVAQRSTAAAVGDYDGNGWLDIYVTSLGPVSGEAPGFHRLYRNNGDGTFTDVATQAGVNFSSPTSSDGWGAAWGDYDLDGDLDLAVAGRQTSDGNRLFRNNGDGTFTDRTSQAGLDTLTGISGFAPRFADMNNNRYPDLLWVGDGGTSKYFSNDQDGTFTDRTVSANVAHDRDEMGHTVADFDNDGLFDWYVTTILSNNLYQNRGNHVYNNVGQAAGVYDTGIGWGTVAVDFDHDGRMDIAATSMGGQFTFLNATPPGGALNFNSVSVGFDSTVSGRGLANFDYDNDGDQDLIIFPNDDPVRVFRNDLSTNTNDANWIRIFLDTSQSPDLAPNGIGTRVVLTIDNTQLYGRIDGGSNYCSQSELSAHFGTGSAEVIDETVVEWSNGEETILSNVAVNQTHTISSVIQHDPTMVSSDPADGAIDARQPSDVDGSNKAGWDSIDITFDMDVALTAADFTVTEDGGDGVAPGIDSVESLAGDTVRINFDDMIEPGAWTTVMLKVSAQRVRIGYLPADADGDGRSSAVDVLTLIDILNGVGPGELHQSDIDRSGVASPPDILRLIDLLNGAGVYEVWNQQQLPG